MGAVAEATKAGCTWLHVDYEAALLRSVESGDFAAEIEQRDLAGVPVTALGGVGDVLTVLVHDPIQR